MCVRVLFVCAKYVKVKSTIDLGSSDYSGLVSALRARFGIFWARPKKKLGATDSQERFASREYRAGVHLEYSNAKSN